MIWAAWSAAMLIGTPSLASTAWCSPSRQWRSGMRPAGELVDDDDLVLVDHVVLIAAEAVVGLQGLLDVLRAACPWRASAGRTAGWSSGPAAGRRRSARSSASSSSKVKCSSRLHLLGELVGPVVDDLLLRRGRPGRRAMMSGVRASSMKMLSASSTRAK